MGEGKGEKKETTLEEGRYREKERESESERESGVRVK